MGHKAGTGTASRVIASEKIGTDGQIEKVDYTLAVLVQSNFGGKRFLTVKGVPVGQILIDEEAKQKKEETEAKQPEKDPEGSIIVIIATDAPLIPIQLQRLCKRATVGIARSKLVTSLRFLGDADKCAASAGGFGSNYSGDIFLAFSTAHHIPRENTQSWTPSVPAPMEVLDTESINPLFEAAFEAVEEAICKQTTAEPV